MRPLPAQVAYVMYVLGISLSLLMLKALMTATMITLVMLGAL